MQYAYLGSSLVVVFVAHDTQGHELDVANYQKKVEITTNNYIKLPVDITPISNTSFAIELTGEITKKLRAGVLDIIVELSSDKDVRVGKASPITLLDLADQRNVQSDKIILNQATTNVPLIINETDITLNMVMGSTIINNGGETPPIDIEVVKKKVFADLWNTACGSFGTYNEASGLFELNGITNISYQDALMIYDLTNFLKVGDFSLYIRIVDNIRTNLPLIASYNGSIGYTLLNTLRFDNIEVLNLASKASNLFGLISSLGANTLQCPKCTKVIGEFMINSTNANALNAVNLFVMPLCEELKINLTSFNPSASATIAFAGLPVINLDSLIFMVSSYTRTQTITIRVHASVYTKLTDPVNYPTWAALVTTAQAKNITFAV